MHCQLQMAMANIQITFRNTEPTNYRLRRRQSLPSSVVCIWAARQFLLSFHSAKSVYVNDETIKCFWSGSFGAIDSESIILVSANSRWEVTPLSSIARLP